MESFFTQYALPLNYLIYIIGIFYSIILHEIGHGLAALFFGDTTARDAGRLSLSPIPHIDLIGTIIIPLFLFISGTRMIFGWAKPVPVNPGRFNKLKAGMITVSLAGVTINFILVGVFLFIYRLTGLPGFLLTARVNIVLFTFNLLPFPPLDGFQFLTSVLPYDLSRRYQNFFHQNQTTILVIVLILLVSGIFFNFLIPIFSLAENFFFFIYGFGSF